MRSQIAIVGIACRYPHAHSAQELWENVLSQRRAFRRFPSERLRLEDYFNPDRSTPDKTYSSQGAFIEDYEFERLRFRISGTAYRASDLTHWLALDVASQAILDAGYHSENLPAQTTGVLVGNSLTGEFTRASTLRLRWPYVRRVVEAGLIEEGWSSSQTQLFLSKLETSYKEPFSPVNEESLAGGLSNTIAGRICNYFNLKGGGYTVDGACASSLLAVHTACTALTQGDLDLAIAGGVDLSLDPFELIGFAKTSALTEDEMRVYDLRSSGFLPGEGCGFAVLMRYEDAVAQHRHIYALISGWGVSSDGSGGITRPEVAGQALSLTRAYNRAQIGIDTISYFEGHGTGTAFGDATELQTICQTRRATNSNATPAVISSIKANIGHTKAAAGIAGLIKAALALEAQIIPPTTGNQTPHPEITSPQPMLKTLKKGILWPADKPLRAAVSAMGFGGINAHLVLEGLSAVRRQQLTEHEETLLASSQDCELFLFQAPDAQDALRQIAEVLAIAPRLSLAELTDLSIFLANNLQEGEQRIAVLASKAAELTTRLTHLQTILTNDQTSQTDLENGIFISTGKAIPTRIGFLFTGQSAPTYLDGGIWRSRFRDVDTLYTQAALPENCENSVETSIAQPTIVTSSLAGLHILKELGITAQVGLGHSLGEFTALHWGGALDQETLLHLARERGQAMSMLGDPTGKMASIAAPLDTVQALIKQDEVSLAGINSPHQTVISGSAIAIETVIARAKARKLRATTLPVSHAFHSPLVAASVEPFAKYLDQANIKPISKAVISTITGTALEADADLRMLLRKQITSPVLFANAINRAKEDVDLWIEVGPGAILQKLASENSEIPGVALDAGGMSLRGLLQVVGLLFARGTPLKLDLLFKQRFSRPIDLSWNPSFFVNPCELAPLPQSESLTSLPVSIKQDLIQEYEPTQAIEQANASSILEVVRQTVAQRAEMPTDYVKDNSRMLSDLHLNSITVGQIVSEAARSLQVLPPVEPTQYADATIIEIAQVLEDIKSHGATVPQEDIYAFNGVDTWVQAFNVTQIEEERPLISLEGDGGSSWELVAPADANQAFLKQLQETLQHVPTTGIAVYLPPRTKKEYLALLLKSARKILNQPETNHFLLVQHSSFGSGLARTLALEAPQKTVTVLEIPQDHPQALAWLQAEAAAASGYTEARYDTNGRRTVPHLQHFPLDRANQQPLQLGAEDVLLVTGGGKGIAAECALALACEYGLKLALIGRSNPENDHELAANLERMQASVPHCHYYQADVAQPVVLSEVIQTIEQQLGPVTAFLHGAGANVPRLLSALEETNLYDTLTPKIDGVQNVLALLDPERLRLFLSFGSIIARTGMRGEADYALANDWLAHLTENFQEQHPACRCLCIEWSIWSGVGMGERLGRVEALMREGILPISPEYGIAILLQLLTTPLPHARMVVASRMGNLPTLTISQPELPFWRFIEQPRIHYSGLELIVDVNLSLSTDLYVDDHQFRGERLLPAVVGLEAIAQNAMALTQQTKLPNIEDVRLDRPIVIPANGSRKIRIASLVREDGKVEVVLRSEETGFQVNHFQAVCSFSSVIEEDRTMPLLELPTQDEGIVDLDPRQDLYGSLLFHQGRYQLVQRYHRLHATECIAEITSCGDNAPYAGFLPSEQLLGDFVMRDAFIHAIQACIPQATILPIAIEQITFHGNLLHKQEPRFLYAKERSRQGDRFIYDLEVRLATGELQERWKGLHLQQVVLIKQSKPWRHSLLLPYLERKATEMLPAAALRLTLQTINGHSKHTSSVQALQSMLGSMTTIQRRADGKPTITQTEKQTVSVSTAHAENLTLAISGHNEVTCDLEDVIERSSEVWQDLLGQERAHLATLLSTQRGETYDMAATRVWAASECLKKAGALIHTPLVLATSSDEEWVILQAGTFLIATYATRIEDHAHTLVLAMSTRAPRMAHVHS